MTTQNSLQFENCYHERLPKHIKKFLECTNRTQFLVWIFLKTSLNFDYEVCMQFLMQSPVSFYLKSILVYKNTAVDFYCSMVKKLVGLYFYFSAYLRNFTKNIHATSNLIFFLTGRYTLIYIWWTGGCILVCYYRNTTQCPSADSI